MKSFALWVDLMMYESVRLSVTEFVSLKMGLKGTPWNFLVCSLPLVQFLHSGAKPLVCDVELYVQ